MRSIRSKITTLVLACVLLCILVMAGIDIWFVTRMQGQSSDQIISLTCVEQTSELNRELIDIEGSVDACAEIVMGSLERLDSLENDEAFTACMDDMELLIGSIAQNTAGVCTYYLRVEQTPGEEPAGFFYTKKGRDAALTKETLTRVTQYDATDVEHVGWYYQPAIIGKAIWMDPYYNQNIDVYMVSYVVPLYVDNAFVGVVGMDINLDFIINTIRYIKVYDTGAAFLVSDQGVVYYHPEAPTGSLLVDYAPELADLIEELPFLSESDKAIVATYTHQGVKQKVACSALRNNMVLMISANLSEINEPLNHMLRTAVVAALLVFVVTMVAGIQLSARITKPLIQLTEAAGRIAEGDLNVSLPKAGNDEVGMLSKSFDTTVQSLRKFVTGMNEKAYRDALTMVKNKAAYNEVTQQLDVRMQYDDVSFGLVMFDVNYLKEMNDQYGHDRGDDYLRTCSQLICNVYDHSPVFRIGGDEFAVIIQGEDLEHREERFVEMDEGMVASQSAEYPWQRISLAKGMSVYQVDDASVDDVFRRADKAMYEDKRRMKAGR